MVLLVSFPTVPGALVSRLVMGAGSCGLLHREHGSGHGTRPG